MNLIKGLRGDTLENLAELWENKNFQEFVALLRLNIDNFGKMCLIRNDINHIRELQYKASSFATIIKIVEDAYEKVNNKPKRRTKKDVRLRK